MRYIEFRNEDDIIECYSIDEFVSESWYLPFDFVLSVADKYEEIRDELMGELLLRATGKDTILKVASSKNYNSLKRSIIDGDNIEKKVHFLLYFEPNMLSMLFGNVNILVNSIIDNAYKNNKSLVDVAEDFVRISHLYDLDNYVFNNMLFALEDIARSECENLSNNNDNGNAIDNINNIKDNFIDIICYNKLKYSKIRTLH